MRHLKSILVVYSILAARTQVDAQLSDSHYCRKIHRNCQQRANQKVSTYPSRHSKASQDLSSCLAMHSHHCRSRIRYNQNVEQLCTLYYRKNHPHTSSAERTVARMTLFVCLQQDGLGKRKHSVYHHLQIPPQKDILRTPSKGRNRDPQLLAKKVALSHRCMECKKHHLLQNMCPSCSLHNVLMHSSHDRICQLHRPCIHLSCVQKRILRCNVCTTLVLHLDQYLSTLLHRKA